MIQFRNEAEAAAWDRYAAAYVAGWMAADPDTLPEDKDMESLAACAADELLEERRKRTTPRDELVTVKETE